MIKNSTEVDPPVGPVPMTERWDKDDVSGAMVYDTVEEAIAAVKEREGKKKRVTKIGYRHQLGKHDQKSHGSWAEGSAYTAEDIEWETDQNYSTASWDDNDKQAVLKGLNRVTSEFPNAPRVTHVKTVDFYAGANKFAEAEPEDDPTVIFVSDMFHNEEMSRQLLVRHNFTGVLVSDSRDDTIVHEYAHILHHEMLRTEQMKISKWQGNRFNISTEVPSAYAMTSQEEWVGEAITDYLENGDKAHPNSKIIAQFMRDAYGGEKKRSIVHIGYRHQLGKHDQDSHGNWSDSITSKIYFKDDIDWGGPVDTWDDDTKDSVIRGLNRVVTTFPNAPRVERVEINDFMVPDEAWAVVEMADTMNTISVGTSFVLASDAEIAEGGELPEAFGAMSAMTGNSKADIITHEYVHVMMKKNNMPATVSKAMVRYATAPIMTDIPGAPKKGVQRMQINTYAPSLYGMTGGYDEWVAEHITRYVNEGDKASATSKHVARIMSYAHGGDVGSDPGFVYTPQYKGNWPPTEEDLNKIWREENK